MKRRYFSIFALSTLSSLAWADIDVSDLYLQNAGFDDESHFDYRISEDGNVAQEILPIYGLNKDFSFANASRAAAITESEYSK